MSTTDRVFLVVLAIAVLDGRVATGFCDLGSSYTHGLGFAPAPLLSSSRRSLQILQAAPAFHSQKSQAAHLLSQNRRGGAVQLRCSERTHRPCASATTLRNFLMQRTVQTRHWYLTALRNEVVASWLADFKDHPHLDVKRMTDYDSTARYHGTDGLRCSWDEYLREMQQTEKKSVTVQYRIGTADIAYWPDQGEVCNEEYKKVWGEDPPWAAAAASRRANPYLQQEQDWNKISYEEVIDPREELEALTTIREQLAKEGILDLALTSDENDRLRLSYQQKDVLQKNVSQVWHKPDILPVFRGEGQSVDATGEDRNAVFESSPFRQLTWDLLLRLMTKIAALDVMAALSADPEQEAQYQWLKGVMGEALPRFEGSGPIQIDKAFLKDLMRRPPSFIATDGREPQLVDPHRVAESILERRAQIASDWIEVLRSIPEDHIQVLRQP